VPVFKQRIEQKADGISWDEIEYERKQVARLEEVSKAMGILVEGKKQEAGNQDGNHHHDMAGTYDVCGF